MGSYFYDQYSLLHFSVGVIFYFWGINIWVWIVLHSLFEIIENTPLGVYYIDYYITLWPGGKKYPDSIINSIGDTIFGILGFYTAKYLDQKMKYWK